MAEKVNLTNQEDPHSINHSPTMNKPRSQSDSLPTTPSTYPALLGFVVMFSALTGFMMGFDLSIIAVVLNPINDAFQLCPAKEFTCFNKELFVAMIAPGALIGSLSGGLLADYCGRRMTLIVSDLLFIAGSVMFYFASSFAWLLAARCIVGSGVGIGFVVFSTYVTEIAPPDRRGRLVLCQEIAQCVGVLSTYLLGTLVGDQHWRFLLVSGALIALVQLAGMPFLPESPRWLLLQGNIVKARQIMKKLGMSESELMMDYEGGVGRSPYQTIVDRDDDDNSRDNGGIGSSSSKNVSKSKPDLSVASLRTVPSTDDMKTISTTESSQLEGPFQTPRHQPSTLMRLWKCKGRLLTACMVGCAQNVLCTNAVLYFSTDLLLIAGVCKPYQWGIGLGIVKLIGTVVAYNLVDTVGRRRLLLCGTGGLGVVFVLLAGAYSLVPQPDVTSAGMFCFSPEGANLGPAGLAGPYSAIVLMGLFGLLFFWEISWAGLMYVVSSEIIPSSVRGIGMGMVVACFWISLFISQLCFELSFRVINVSGTFIGLAIASLFVLLFTFMMIPDLTGQSLESIHRMLSPQASMTESGDSHSEATPINRKASAQKR